MRYIWKTDKPLPRVYMSSVKRHMEEEESKHQVAVRLLLEVGILENCERHEEIVFQSGAGDIKDAYKLANTKWAEYSGIFTDRREMTDLILAESQNGDYANDGCEICRGQQAKD